jgi:hypothetical protein
MGTVRQVKERRHNYEGQYVALSSSGDKRVIASGPKVGPVFDEARKQGETAPTIVFVPKSNTAYFY